MYNKFYNWCDYYNCFREYLFFGVVIEINYFLWKKGYSCIREINKRIFNVNGFLVLIVEVLVYLYLSCFFYSIKCYKELEISFDFNEFII